MPCCPPSNLSLLVATRSDTVTERASGISDAAGGALRRRANWLQLAKFCVVGVSGYVVNLAVFAALVVEVELLAHENERRGDGDRDIADIARGERKVAVGAVAAKYVEAEHALQPVVEEYVHDHAEADVGIANRPACDGACAKTPVHRLRNSPARKYEN